MKTAVLYVIFKEYDFLERQVTALNEQTRRDFTLVVVTGHEDDLERVRAILGRATFPTELVPRTGDTGPAGGFRLGQSHCLANGYDVVVHVESDCFPTGPDLVARLLDEIERHPVVVPLCVPDGIPMGWRWCAVRRAVLEDVGLSYEALYFLTEDVHFYRNVARRYPPRVLEDVRVFHAPIITKHKLTDRFLASFPYLLSRNHMLFNFDLIRRHGDPRDVVNFIAYTMSLALFGLHLLMRGKRASGARLLQGLWDGTLGREGKILKDRMEEAAVDYQVEETPAFDADVVLDKIGHEITLGVILRSLTVVRRRVLIRRPSQFVVLVVYYLASAMAVTDGERTWTLKQRPREGLPAYVAFYLGLVVSAAAAVLLLALGLAVRIGRPSSVEWSPRPAGAGG